MPAKKWKPSINVGGTWYHEQADGSYAAKERTQEDELAAATSTGSTLGGTYGSPEKTSLVKDIQDENLRNLGVSTAAELATGGMSRYLPPGVIGGVPKTLKNRFFDRLATEAAGGLAGTGASSLIAGMQGQENVDSLKEGAMNQVLNMATQGGMNALTRVGRAGVSAAKSGKVSDLFPNAKEIATKFAANRSRLTGKQQDDFLSAMSVARTEGLPMPGILGMEGVPVEYLGHNAIAKLLNEVGKGQTKIYKKVVSDIPTQTRTFSENVRANKVNFLNRKSTAKQQERAMHESFDQDVQNNVTTVPVQVGITPSTTTDYAGNVIQTQPQPIMKDVTITGPVDVTETLQWANGLTQELDLIRKSGNLNPDAENMLNQTLGLLQVLQNAPTIDGHRIANYDDVKTIRNAVGRFLKENPAITTGKRMLKSNAKKLTSGLSRDTANSVNNPSMWSPQSAIKYAEMNELTKKNTREFSSLAARRLEGIQDSPEIPGIPGSGSVHGLDLENDNDQAMLKALSSPNELKKYLRMGGPESAEPLASLFIKNGFDSAMDKNGLYNADKLEQYFKKDVMKNSILESDVMSPDQRRVVKDFINYTKRLSSVTETAGQGATWRNNKILGGSISFGMGAGGAMLAGAPMPMASKVGGVLAATMHMGREFAERVLLDPEGGKIVQNMIYAPTTQKRMKWQQQLIEFGIRTGIKTKITYKDPATGEEKTKTVN